MLTRAEVKRLRTQNRELRKKAVELRKTFQQAMKKLDRHEESLKIMRDNIDILERHAK